MRRLDRCVLVLVCAVLGGGCISSSPLLAGGRKTPKGKSQLILGGSSRLAFGDLQAKTVTQNEAQTWRNEISKGGVVPVAAARYGLSSVFDLDVLVSGAELRSMLRGAWELHPGGVRGTRVQLLSGLGISGRYWDRDTLTLRSVGSELPLLLGLEIGGIFELWSGLRLGAELQQGRYENGSVSDDFSAYALRVGPVLGFALGFNHLHALVELSAFYESLTADLPSSQPTFAGVVLVPAFALRFTF